MTVGVTEDSEVAKPALEPQFGLIQMSNHNKCVISRSLIFCICRVGVCSPTPGGEERDGLCKPVHSKHAINGSLSVGVPWLQEFWGDI